MRLDDLTGDTDFYVEVDERNDSLEALALKATASISHSIFPLGDRSGGLVFSLFLAVVRPSHTLGNNTTSIVPPICHSSFPRLLRVETLSNSLASQALVLLGAPAGQKYLSPLLSSSFDIRQHIPHHSPFTSGTSHISAAQIPSGTDWNACAQPNQPNRLPTDGAPPTTQVSEGHCQTQ